MPGSSRSPRPGTCSRPAGAGEGSEKHQLKPVPGHRPGLPPEPAREEAAWNRRSGRHRPERLTEESSALETGTANEESSRLPPPDYLVYTAHVLRLCLYIEI